MTAAVIPKGNDVYTLRLGSGSNSAGEYGLLMTVTAANGFKTYLNVLVRVRRPTAGIPTANDISIVTSAGVGKAFTLIGNDAQNRSLNLSLFSSPAHGTISGNQANLIYTPRSGFSGIDAFTYRAVVSGTATASEEAVVYGIVR